MAFEFSADVDRVLETTDVVAGEGEADEELAAMGFGIYA